MTSQTRIPRRRASLLRPHRLAALAFGVALLAAAPARADSDNAKKSADAVRSLFAAINARDLPGVMMLLADDIVYKNTGLPTFRGKPVVEAFLTPVFQVLSAIDFRAIDLLAGESVVMVRRIDTVDVFPLGGALALHLEIPVMGYFHVNAEGKITLWADYFDTWSWDTGTGLPLPKQFPPDNQD